MSSGTRQSLSQLLRQLLAVQQQMRHRYLIGTRAPVSTTYRQFNSSVTTQSASNGSSDNGNSSRTFTSITGTLRSKARKDVGESTIMVQEGINILEVPVPVLKSNGVASEESETEPSTLPYVQLDPREEQAFIEGFNKFHTPGEILKILDTMPSQEVTPPVALCVIRKIFELENNFSFRNNGKPWLMSTEAEEGNTNNLQSFGRIAILSRLIDTVISSEDNQIVLQALDVLGLEANNSSVLRYYFETNEEFLNYRLKLCNEVLIRVIEGKLRLEEICQAICSIGQIGRSNGKKESNRVKQEMQAKFLDKFWPGILEKSHSINSENMYCVVNAVQYLNKSRRLVMDLVEKKIILVWWNLKLSQIAKICEIITTEDRSTKESQSPTHEPISNRVLIAFSRNLSLNLHKVSEQELTQIIRAFHSLGFCDPTTEKTLSRYMKAKSLKICDSTLVTTVMAYVAKFRIRSSHILESASEYMVSHHDILRPAEIASIITPFGYMDFQPINPIKFWQTLETILAQKLIQFTPKDLIELLLSCVYLQKFPLNFVQQIFSPYFLDRLHTSESDFTSLQRTRSRLKLLDSALTLECGRKYSGPLLPRDFSAKSNVLDGRITRMVHMLDDSFNNLFKKSTCITEKSVKLPNMPFNELYFVDLFINVIPASTLVTEQDNPVEVNLKMPTDILRQRFNPRSPGSSLASLPKQTSSNSTEQQKVPDNELIAVLIHIPEHFCSDGNHLIGPQMMRIRHLKLLGLTVVSLKFQTLTELRHQPQALQEYLEESLTSSKVMTS